MLHEMWHVFLGKIFECYINVLFWLNRKAIKHMNEEHEKDLQQYFENEKNGIVDMELKQRLGL